MSTLRHISGISIAIAIGVFVLGGLIVATTTLTAYSREPAEFLPAEKTLAVLHNVNSAVLNQYSVWLPELARVPIQDSSTVAILQLNNDQRAVLVFHKQNSALPTGEFWPFFIESYPPEAEELLQHRLQPLMKHDGYRSFSRSKKLSESWVFVRTDALPNETTTYANAIRSLLFQDAESVSLQTTDMHVRIELQKPSSDYTAIEVPQLLTDQPILSLSMGNARDALLRTWQQLNNQDKIVLTAVLQALVHKNAGSTVSGQYDLLPLLSETTELALGYSASGTFLGRLQGTLRDEKILKEKLQQLQASRNSIQPATELLQLQLDTQFRLRSLRMSETPPQDSVQISQQRNAFSIRNFEQAATKQLPLTLSQKLLASSHRSIGYADLAALRLLLEKELVYTVENSLSLPIFPPDTKTVYWLWEERGDTAVIQLQFSQ